MLKLRTVLCPIDFSDLSHQELSLAVDVCEAFGARLVLHHNLAAVSPGFTRVWEWNEVHRAEEGSAARADERIRALLADLPQSVNAEATISHGPLATVLLHLAEQLPADLVVLGSHGWSTEDHASLTERIIDRCPCPVLTIQQGMAYKPRLRLREQVPVVVPTDLSQGGRSAIDYACELARSSSVQLHLLHVVPAGTDAAASEMARRRLQALVPPDLAERTTCHLQEGEPGDEILRLSQRTDASFMVAGEHARPFLRRLFTQHTARAVLHQASCPVWFVPPRA